MLSLEQHKSPYGRIKHRNETLRAYSNYFSLPSIPRSPQKNQRKGEDRINSTMDRPKD